MASSITSTSTSTSDDGVEVNRNQCDSTSTATSSSDTDQIRRNLERQSEDDDDSFPGGEDAYSHPVNPTRDALQEGIIGLLRPTVESLDERVSQTRAAQDELKTHIEALNTELEDILRKQQDPRVAGVDLEGAIYKLNNAKKRVVVVANLLQSAQDRLNKVHQNCLRETAKRRTLLEPSPAGAQSVNVGEVKVTDVKK